MMILSSSTTVQRLLARRSSGCCWLQHYKYWPAPSRTTPNQNSRPFGSSQSLTTTDNNNNMTTLWNPTPEHQLLRNTLQSFVKKRVEPQANAYNQSETFNKELFTELGTLGCLGLTVSPQYGGVGMDATSVCLVHEELSYSDPGFCLSYLAHSLLFCNNLYVNSTCNLQKQEYLPRVCAGQWIGGMGMSEPGAGTDVLGMRTKAVRDANNNNKWILNGTKMWITNGTIDDGTTPGDVFLIYAKTGEQRSDITQFVVESTLPGFSVGQKITNKLGMRSSCTAELVFDNMELDDRHVVGKVNQATLCMMRNLEIERLGLAAMALGIARRSLDEMRSYSVQREAFGKPIVQFGQIQKLLADSYAKYMAGRCYVYSMARGLDLHTHGNGLNADGTKLYCAQMCKEVADAAIQVLGGYGYVGEYTVERLWRDSKLLEIGGGTNESHHKNMVRDLCKMDQLG